jgi:hypothetical protein
MPSWRGAQLKEAQGQYYLYLQHPTQRLCVIVYTYSYTASLEASSEV